MAVDGLRGAPGTEAGSRLAAGTELRPFFDASSVVVVGASSDPTKNSGKPLYHLSRHGYRGQVCAVNPRHDEIFGFPSYRSVDAIPWPPELALVMLPAAGAAEAIRACGARGARAAVVFGNGFADAGRADLQEELALAAREAGMRLLGPNCLGAVNTANGLTASFSSYLLRRMFRPGHVALATQSGSVGNAILMDFQDLGVGLSKWVATGNEADTDLLDVVEYLVDDPASHVIAVFAEAFKRGWRWPQIATRARDLGKPIIVLKAGVGTRSAQAVISHSGKIAGVHKVWEDLAALEHLTVVESVEELCDAAQALSIAPRAAGGFAILGSGGSGVLAVDECQRRDLPVAELGTSTTRALRGQLPPAASVENPVDPTPTTDVAWSAACQTIVNDPGVGYFTVVISSLVRPHEITFDLLRPTTDDAARLGKAMCVTYLAASDPMDPALRERLRAQGVLTLPTPARSVRALAHLRRSAVRTPEVNPAASQPTLAAGAAPHPRPASVVPAAGLQGIGRLEQQLRGYRISVAATHVVRSAEEAVRAVAALRGPGVLKLEDPLVPHKTEHGLIRLAISDPQEAAAAFDSLQGQAVDSDAVVVVQPQIGPGVEVLVSCTIDAELGPVVTVGAGGILTELIADTCSSPAPVSPERAVDMIARTRVSRLLTGYRGIGPHDLAALSELIAGVSRFFVEHGGFTELELNPVVVLATGSGAVVVDALAVPRPPAAPASQPCDGPAEMRHVASASRNTDE
jgi:acetate---CoA ligase (ADP-forming)